jgi:hypothetical protein
MWFARIWGLTVSAYWLYQIIILIVAGGFSSLQDQMSTGIIMFLLFTTLSIGVLIAWRYPLTGGKFIIILSVLLSIFVYFTNDENHIIPIVYQGLPFFLVGLLFVQSQSGKEDAQD